MVAPATPVERRRCPLCLAILEIVHTSEGGMVSRVSSDRHTPEACRESTLQRIKVLEEVHQRDARELETQSGLINDLGEWIGLAGEILDAGKKWLPHREKRAEDVARLRSVVPTGVRRTMHPLFEAEEQVAQAIAKALAVVERRPAS